MPVKSSHPPCLCDLRFFDSYSTNNNVALLSSPLVPLSEADRDPLGYRFLYRELTDAESCSTSRLDLSYPRRLLLLFYHHADNTCCRAADIFWWIRDGPGSKELIRTIVGFL